MLKDIYQAVLKKCSFEEITEIRLRVKKPICVVCNTKTYFLSDDGICNSINQAIMCSKEMIEKIIFRATDFSLYAANEQLKKGYIMVGGGVRLGVCGEIVFDGEIKTIRNFSSICIRIPHAIKNVALKMFKHICESGEVNNTLIVSAPGAGKTTMLRDILYQFSNHNYPYTIFVADERGEISGGADSGIDLGLFCDVVCFLNKKDAIMHGIRSNSPNIIATDELGGLEDFNAIEYAINCGVNIIATIHAKDIEELKYKPEFKNFVNNKYFNRYIVLNKDGGVGNIEGVYNKDFQRIYGAIIWE